MSVAAQRSDIWAVLQRYPPELQPQANQPQSCQGLGGAGGFSGAQFWKVLTLAGTGCLRCWPAEHPTPDRLLFIHAVLQHIQASGCAVCAVPYKTITGETFVTHHGRLWELAPWMPGKADFAEHPSPAKLTAAMHTLAEVHLAMATFPAISSVPQTSLGVRARLAQLQHWLNSGLPKLQASLRAEVFPELLPLAVEVLERFRAVAPRLLTDLQQAMHRQAVLQPCLRDIWHVHLLFTAGRVTGLIDFGALHYDHITTDIARLLGSMAGDDAAVWTSGLAAYQTLRPLTSDELAQIHVFDASGTALGALNWLQWIYLDGRTFESMADVQPRLVRLLSRLNTLAQGSSSWSC